MREHKRHTARRVASTRHAFLAGGIPFPGLDGGYPLPMSGGFPLPRFGWGYPLSRSGWRGLPLPRSGWRGYPLYKSGWGYPLSLTWAGGTPHPDLGRGYSPTWPGKGVLPHQEGWGYTPSAGWGYIPPPPPPRNGEKTDIPKYKYYLPSYFVRGQ